MSKWLRCKGCGKGIEVGRWCTECYYEYHESREELCADERDYDMGGDEDG